MSIVEMLAHVGAENISWQRLATDTNDMGIRKSKGFITFGTDGSTIIDQLNGQESKQVGIVLWMDRERLPEHLRNKL